MYFISIIIRAISNFIYIFFMLPASAEVNYLIDIRLAKW